MFQGHTAIIVPQGIRRNIFHDDLLSSERRRSAGTGLGANGEPIDCAHIIFREVRSCAVPDVNAIRVEQEDRRKHPRALQLDYPQERVENLVQGFAPGNEVQHEALAFQ